MARTLFIVVAALVAAVLVFAATRPDTFHVERSVTIDAPADRIFSLIDDFRRWGLWSPYEKLDPGMQRNFSEPAGGVGATYGWSSDGSAGVGNMKITAAERPSKVALDLNFIEPFNTSNAVEFTLRPGSGGTRVTWSMRGPLTYTMKVMHVFFDMDKMVGGDFEAGLADLKAAAESAAGAHAAP